MCGLYASIGFPPDPRYLDIVAHRGPDGRGWRTFDSAVGPVALGHRRLSIIDLDERAAQPMSCARGRYWLTFNGEIYNFLELRAELEARGRRFITSSDSEVLLQAYVEWGESSLDRLLGMFAFVIYDAIDQRIFAARDRFGIKPLYYFAGRRGLAFASEIKQLIEQPGFSRRMNLPRTFDFLSAGYTDHTDETMFAEARQLRAGQCLTIDLRRWRLGESLPVRRYYDLPREAGPAIGEAEAASRFRELFDDSIRLHMRSDVRVGSCLSGGLDSSSIVVALAELLTVESEPIHTFSACYAEKEVDEKPFMDAVGIASRTEPHFIYPKPDQVFDMAEKVTWHQDEPFGSTSIFAGWCVFEEARRSGIKVVLDGQGADEQLAGYHESFAHQTRALSRRGDWCGIFRMMADRKRWHGLGLTQQVMALPGRPRLPARLKRRQPPPDGDCLDSALLNAAKTEHGPFGDVLVRDALGEVEDIGDLCLAYMAGSSLPRLLRYEDRNSMAHSIEARLPFLDHRLVEFNLRLWDRHKVVGGDTKRVLRRAMADRLPKVVLKRRDKLGFNTPEERWFRGPLRTLVEAGVHQTLDLYPDLLNKGEVLTYMDAALNGRRPVDYALWRIVNLGVWGKVFNVVL